MTPLEAFFFFLIQFGLPVIAIASVIGLLVGIRSTRRMKPVVMFHKKAPYAEFYSCREIGNRIEFVPKAGFFKVVRPRDKISVVRGENVKPEVQVRGLKTYSIHHVVEGWAETVDIRQIPQLMMSLRGYSTCVECGHTVLGRADPELRCEKCEGTMWEYTNPSAITQTAGASVATAMAVMDETFASMGKTLPKSKGEITMVVMIGLLCWALGLFMGMAAG